MTDSFASRRDFLSGLRGVTGSTEGAPIIPVSGSTVRMATRAMACEFSVIMNPGSHQHVPVVSDTLEMFHDIETWLSIYRSTSEISHVNRLAADHPVEIRRPLLELLTMAQALSETTSRAFDIAAGAQVQLWKRCRAEQRIPTEAEISSVQECSGTHHLVLDQPQSSVRFAVPGLQLDPGAIGKGFALDQAAQWLRQTADGPSSFLLHGGHSSVVAQGHHNGFLGWPVGLGNPLFTKKRLGTLLLKNRALSTSGSNIQFFRHEGRRYGHILDPRTALPVDGMLSVTVLADSAAVADAVSTAFFVLGVENAQKCCDNLENVAVILIPFPDGAKVRPTVIGLPPDQIFWDEDQVIT